jgi:formylglycine-generating enzyme required for sulfatase activity
VCAFRLSERFGGLKRTAVSLFLALLLSYLLIPCHLFASTRGIQVTVTTPKRKTIDLYKGSYALVIGNGVYEKGWDPLPGAIRDVEEVAEALRKNGFEVTLKTDLTKATFSRALSEFVRTHGKQPDNRLLFYYAGHGYTEKMATGEELGYLVMVDAAAPDRDPVGFSLASVDMQALLTQAKMIRSKHVLFMFDSCFSGTVLNVRDRVTPSVISDNVIYPVRQFITAGRANEPVPDRSVFKETFLDILEGRDQEPIPDGYLTGEELGLYLKNKVPEYNPMQHPQYGKIRDPKLDKGDFVFILAGRGGAASERPDRRSKTATLSVAANVSGARVYLDGEKKGESPITLENISPGNYELKVVKPGYEPYEDRVMINQGKATEVWASLNKVPTTGMISISGFPEGAKVYLDGYFSGELPCAIHRVEQGKHTIGVQESGYKDWAEKVRVVAGDTVNLEANLERDSTQVAMVDPSEEWFKNSVGMEFILVPPGKFEMGSPNREWNRDKDERHHKVMISKPFYIQSTEVTQAQWRAVMGDNPSYFDSCDRCPVERVSWDDCQEFILRLNQMERTIKYRLPTEAEWEYACRAGSVTRFSFGDDDSRLSEYGWNINNSGGQTHPVGRKEPNAWGLYDMHGNVWEWCQDWYRKYRPFRATDPQGPSQGSNRVYRGGGWNDPSWDCRSAERGSVPIQMNHTLGFRLARTQ